MRIDSLFHNSVVTALLMVSGLMGCAEPNPAYLGARPGDNEGGSAGSGTAGSQGTGNSTDAGTTGGSGGGVVVDAMESVDLVVPNCTPKKCEDLNGKAPCGQWQCNNSVCAVVCQGCNLDQDQDGYGQGAGCAGPDCDDKSKSIGANVAPKACYSGGGATQGKGVCRNGVQSCTAGTWTRCEGEVRPGGEACNAQDDDCDGATDEELGTVTCGLGVCSRTIGACGGGSSAMCVAALVQTQKDGCGNGDEDCDGAVDEDCGCVFATTAAANGSGGHGSLTQPFRSLQMAIDTAEASNEDVNVCVIGGADCASPSVMILLDSTVIKMKNGVSVYGNYRSDGQRCPNGNNLGVSTITEIKLHSDSGIEFDSAIKETTVLDGFKLSRGSGRSSNAITVKGAKKVVLSNLHIGDIAAGNAEEMRGVLIDNGAEVLVTRSSIWAGQSAKLSVGIHVKSSVLTLLDACKSFDNRGRCNAVCDGSVGYGVRGQLGSGTAAAESFAVLLENAEGSHIERSSVCGGNGQASSAVRIIGKSDAVILRGNTIGSNGGATDSHGIWAGPCEGTAPRIVDNASIEAMGRTANSRVSAIRVQGDCPAVIENNALIAGSQEGGIVATLGIHCTGADNKPNLCSILSNADIRGSRAGFPPSATGIRCDDGSCNRIDRNTITGGSGRVAQGLVLGATGPVVSNNQITAGCAEGVTHGVLALDSFARLENNIIAGNTCAADGIPGISFGLQVVPGPDSRNEIDVHSNLIEGLSRPAACISVGIAIGDAASKPRGPSGTYRNNLVHGGNCKNQTAIRESSIDMDPRIVENNNLIPAANGALYFNENLTAIDLAAVNQLTGSKNNLSVVPQFVQYRANLRLAAGSMCIDAGTSLGAPSGDLAGTARDTKPDIGPYEFH
ncbi:MAG: choice-of-anchor Q domain-containing protein [Deltaproteobacteria bacterium]|nr:choice-of-anchor Q domain-containing protein [Deltaproteobacteria bacterium]